MNVQKISFGAENSELEKKVESKTLFDDISEGVREKEETPAQTILKSMFIDRTLFDKSEVTNEENGIIAQFLYMCDRWDLRECKKFIDYFLLLRISKDRFGRIEGFGALKSENEAKNNTQPFINFFGGKLPRI